MKSINLNKELGINHTKYQRKSYLKSIKLEDNTAEIIRIDTEYFIIIPDEVITLKQLTSSDYISDAQRNTLLNVIQGTDSLKTEYRKGIIANFSSYYEFVRFNNSKGKNRKLLLGKKREIPLHKVDGRNLGNNSLSYANQGAYLVLSFLKNITEKRTSPLFENSSFVDDKGKLNIIFTRSKWYEIVISLNKSLSQDLSSTELNKSLLAEKQWDVYLDKYKDDKQQFYNSRLNSFLKRINKLFPINYSDKVVGVILENSESSYNYDEHSYALTDDLVVLKKTAQEKVKLFEMGLLKDLNIKKYEAIRGRTPKAKKFKKSMDRFISETYHLKKIWTSVSIEIEDDFNNLEIERTLSIADDNFDDIKSNLNMIIEEDWSDFLTRSIHNNKKKSSEYILPRAYYNSILGYLIYSYLDNYLGFKCFSEEQAKTFLNDYFIRENESFNVSDELELIGLSDSDIFNQLDEGHEYVLDNIKSYSILSQLKDSIEKDDFCFYL